MSTSKANKEGSMKKNRSYRKYVVGLLILINFIALSYAFILFTSSHTKASSLSKDRSIDSNYCAFLYNKAQSFSVQQLNNRQLTAEFETVKKETLQNIQKNSNPKEAYKELQKLYLKEEELQKKNQLITLEREDTPETRKAPTEKKGIILVNKKNPLPATYNPLEQDEARRSLQALQQDVRNKGYALSTAYSGYRSYNEQIELYASYVRKDGEKAATYSAKPGYSEHQTGLAFDLLMQSNELLGVYGHHKDVVEYVHSIAPKYGFIVRYPEGKENITGYMYEPWHLRYVGVEHAQEMTKNKLTLEEYLNVEGGEYP